jgi:hypothetical protein
MPRCTAIADWTGKPCRSFALIGEDKCLFHSQSDVAIKARTRPARKLTKKDMICELQLQLRKVKASEADPLEKSREIRALLYQINNLRKEDESPKEKEEEPEKDIDTFEERIKKSMEEKK